MADIPLLDGEFVATLRAEGRYPGVVQVFISPVEDHLRIGPACDGLTVFPPTWLERRRGIRAEEKVLQALLEWESRKRAERAEDEDLAGLERRVAEARGSLGMAEATALHAELLTCARCQARHTRAEFLAARGCPSCAGGRFFWGDYNTLSARKMAVARQKKQEGRVSG